MLPANDPVFLRYIVELLRNARVPDGRAPLSGQVSSRSERSAVASRARKARRRAVQESRRRDRGRR